MSDSRCFILSVWQPWATLLARQVKAIETRSYAWRGSMPCAFAIHAAKKKHSFLRDYADKFRSMGLLADLYDELPFGAVVGCGVLADCLSTSFLMQKGRINKIEEALGDFSPNRFGWMFSRMEEIEPIAMPGQQGPWPWRNVGSYEVPDWFVEFRGE